MSLNEEFFAYLESRGISQNEAAKSIGYSASVLSALRQDKYKGNSDEAWGRIADWLERERSRISLLDTPIVETSVLKRIMGACDIALEEKDIAVIVGYAGNGKTFALEEYVRRHPGTVYYLAAAKYTTQHVLTLRLAETLGLSLKGNAADITARIIAFLASRDALIIIDQADDLSDGALEYLRQVVFDDGRSGLVLAGLPKLSGQIQNARNDHDQLLSRVGLYVRLPSVELDDMRKIVRCVWPAIEEEVEGSLLTESCLRLRSEVRPSLRRLSKIMKRAHRVIHKNKLALPTVEVVKESAQYIMTLDSEGYRSGR